MMRSASDANTTPPTTSTTRVWVKLILAALALALGILAAVIAVDVVHVVLS